MHVAFFRYMAAAAICVFIAAGHATAQSLPGDSSGYSVEKLDSSQIRRLPLTRDVEAGSFLPRTNVGLRYETQVRGAIGGSDIRVDGIPVTNLTFGRTLLELPINVLQSATVFASGTPVAYARPTALEYATAAGSARWTGKLATRTDEGLPGSVGHFRVDANAGGPLGSLRFNFALVAQSAVSTEFNNTGDVTLYGVSGVDTTVAFDPGNGTIRMVDVPAFVALDDNRLPGTNWNDLLGSARLDFLNTARTRAFATAHFTRAQALEFGAEHIFSSTAQVAERRTAGLIGLMVDHALAANSRITLSLAFNRDERLRGALAPDGIAELRTAGAGPQLGKYEFLVEDDFYTFSDSLFILLRGNGFPAPFLFRHEMTTRSDFRFSPYGVYGFTTSGQFRDSDQHQVMRESRLFGNATWRGSYGAHNVTAGGELTRSNTRAVETPFVTGFGSRAWMEEPTSLAAFVEDEFRTGRVHVQAGLRVDAFSANADYSAIPAFLGDEVISAPTSTAVSPRVAFAMPLGPAMVRVNAGFAAYAPTFASQFNNIHSNFLVFRNTNANEPFVRPLELIKEKYAVAGVQLPLGRTLFDVTAFQMQAKNDVGVMRVVIDDPTNPGVPQSLNVLANNRENIRRGLDAVATYRAGRRNTVQLGITHEISEVQQNGTTNLFDPTSLTSIVGLATFTSPWRAALQDIEVTLALRAAAPMERQELLPDFRVVSTETAWITRFDTRIAKSMRLGGMTGKLWLDGLRLLGSAPFADPQVNTFYVETQRRLVGGNDLMESISLASLEGNDGIFHEVDLIALRQAERLFGNGDLTFTRAEQEAAFSAASRYSAMSLDARSQDRRIVLGIELAF